MEVVSEAAFSQLMKKVWSRRFTPSKTNIHIEENIIAKIKNLPSLFFVLRPAGPRARLLVQFLKKIMKKAAFFL